MGNSQKLNWSKVWDAGNYNTEEHAGRLRRALVDADVYPPREAETFHLRGIKATLPEILEALDATDLLAVYRVARLLAIAEHNPEVFEYGAARTAAALTAIKREAAMGSPG